MKYESRIFTFGIFSTDEKGEKLEAIEICASTRTELIRYLERCGVYINFNYPYSAKGKKTYAVESKLQNIEKDFGCRFGEFKHNIHCCFERNGR